LSNYNIADPVFTPTTAGTYTFEVLVTNKYGCTTTCSITVCVMDIRVPGTNGKKVYVCHVPPGNSANPQTLSINVSAVPSHLDNHADDKLGSCDQSCGTASRNYEPIAIQQGTEELIVKATPNPTTNYFVIRISSKDTKTKITVRVMDGIGKRLQSIENVSMEQPVRFGSNFNNGTYYVEVIQGNKRKIIQLVKAG
jgi:PKD repeat protein